jgi:hypothetical protein
MNAMELIDALKAERAKFTKADKDVMQGYIDALIECGEYPAELTPVMAKQGTTHLRMVEGYGADWHRYSGPLECRHCKADLRNHESGPPFKREIGISDRLLDRITGYKCPDCGEML